MDNDGRFNYVGGKDSQVINATDEEHDCGSVAHKPFSAGKVSAHHLGMVAYNRGETESDNPYEKGTEEHLKWSQGWNYRDAQEDSHE